MSDGQDIDVTPQPVSADAGPRLAVEKWAERKGLWPQFGAAPTYRLPAGAQAGAPAQVSMGGIVGPRPNPQYWKFAAARAHERWPEGKELTEAEFDAAIAVATGHVAR